MRLGIVGLGVGGKALLQNAYKAGYDQILTYDTSCANNTLSHIDQVDVMCLSAGIDVAKADNKIKELAQHKNLVNDIELFFRHKIKPKVIAVTGSYGKSSVVFYINQVLTEHGVLNKMVGNIGNPIWDYFEYDGVFVLELSSYQLELLTSLKAQIGAITNIYPHHLARHKVFEIYAQLKTKLLDTSDISIDNRQLNLSNKELALHIVESFLHKKIVHKNWIELEHRQEIFIQKDGFLCINDSKSTAPKAVQYALNSVCKDVILICGGKWDATAEWGCVDLNRVKELLLFGQARFELMKILEHDSKKTFEMLEEVVQFLESAGKLDGDHAILFSPGCQSFDQFDNFEHRGKRFKELVLNRF